MKRSSMLAFVLTGLALLTTGCGYNTIQTLDEKVNQAQGQISPDGRYSVPAGGVTL